MGEAAALRECILQHRESPSSVTLILDFGCGDGRYLNELLHISREHGPLRVVATDISLGALEAMFLRAKTLGCKPIGSFELAQLWSQQSLVWDTLELVLLLADGTCSVETVEMRCHEVLDGEAHVVVCGWGTLSSIPPMHGVSRQEAFLAAFGRLGKSLMNVLSNKHVNHLVPQRRFNAMRQALADENLTAAAREWLLQRLRMAVLPDTYYYPVGVAGSGREWLFYSGIGEEGERDRLCAAGYSNVQVRICSIINFYDVLTKPRAAKLNNAIMALLEQGKHWKAQLLLSRCVARATSRPLHEFRTAPLFNEHWLRNQVARYFVSIASR